MKTKHLLFLVLLFPLLSGCNDSDDVSKIFFGKTWKLRDIIEGDKSSDYWDGDEEAEAASRELMEQENNCTIKFSGTITGNTISGTISGRAINNAFSGTWNVDGESRTFSIPEITPNTDSDVLGQAFLYGLNHATSYSGDESNLYIYFKEGGKSKFLLLHIPK
ncbi:DUF4847 family protein [Bacteroides ihuae]|uniref:DUF4847 family protein n=1 Tax=Bacteroides ihuae TaxID=1852362 RepID=UPI0008DA1ADD|nr:DUF4847 family protein [Bacteroides ihuae]